MKTYLVDRSFDISKANPDDKSQLDVSKQEGKKRLEKLNAKLVELQELLFAQKKHKLLVVIQAMDAGGKDGLIRSVFAGTNPACVRVAYFGAPTENELSHDYLWRIHAQTPKKGELTIFNRSHYEDVLVVRVKELVQKSRWKKRYAHIRHFEEMLADEGTTIVKLYLHISKEEQRVRQQERIDDPSKRWKFRKGDLEDRALWSEYMEAFEDALKETSKPHAPWYWIPANSNWYRDYVVTKILVGTLEGLNMSYPEPEEGLEGLVVE